jgi:hypothetical protein
MKKPAKGGLIKGTGSRYKAYQYAKSTASPRTQWRSNRVSPENLPKTGIFAVIAGDFSVNALRVLQFGRSETGAKLQKPANSGLFCV